jgi:hypothetical protein
LSSHARTLELVEMDRRVAELEGHISEISAYRKEIEMFKQQSGGISNLLEQRKKSPQ